MFISWCEGINKSVWMSHFRTDMYLFDKSDQKPMKTFKNSYFTAFTSNVHTSLTLFLFLKMVVFPSLSHDTEWFYLALLLFFSVHFFAPLQDIQSFCFSSVTVHLFPFSLSSSLSPLPLTLSFLVPSCLSKGRKSLKLETPTGSYSSSGTLEIEYKGSDLLCFPSSWVARWVKWKQPQSSKMCCWGKQREAHWASLCPSVGEAV